MKVQDCQLGAQAELKSYRTEERTARLTGASVSGASTSAEAEPVSWISMLWAVGELPSS